MKLTKNRKQILELLEKEGHALSAQDIYDQLSTDMDLATVYRALAKFTEVGEVRELRVSKTESLYEVNHDNHEHAICLNCGEIRHIQVNKQKLIASLKDQGVDLSDFEIEDIEINLKGKCK